MKYITNWNWTDTQEQIWSQGSSEFELRTSSVRFPHTALATDTAYALWKDDTIHLLLPIFVPKYQFVRTYFFFPFDTLNLQAI